MLHEHHQPVREELRPDPEIRDAMALIARVREGSVDAWHRFIDRYSGLVFRVIRRYLPAAGVDEQRTVYVRVLESLYRGRLDGYEGKSRLSTWLFIYTRSRCLDHLRAQLGRRADPSWLRRLPAVDREVYRLYYLHGMSGNEICSRLARDGRPMAMEALAESLERLEQHVDDGVRRRLAFDLQARSMGLTSGRLLDYLHRLRIETELAEDDSRPDRRLREAETGRLLSLIRDFVSRLPDLERRVIDLRFYSGRTARSTARELGVEGQRRVYTLEARALRRLRSMFQR